MANVHPKSFKKKFIRAYLANEFNITKTCKLMAITRETYYSWRKNDAWFVSEMDDAEEKALDQLIEECEITHRVLRKGIPKFEEKEVDGAIVYIQTGWAERPDRAAIEFYLRTKGKGKGYGENIDLTTKGEKLVMAEEEIKARIDKIDKILSSRSS